MSKRTNPQISLCLCVCALALTHRASEGPGAVGHTTTLSMGMASGGSLGGGGGACVGRGEQQQHQGVPSLELLRAQIEQRVITMAEQLDAAYNKQGAAAIQVRCMGCCTAYCTVEALIHIVLHYRNGSMLDHHQ